MDWIDERRNRINKTAEEIAAAIINSRISKVKARANERKKKEKNEKNNLILTIIGFIIIIITGIVVPLVIHFTT